MATITYHGNATLSEIQAAVGQMHMVLADSTGNLHAYRIATAPGLDHEPNWYGNRTL